MERQKKVIDASVIFKWFSNEDSSLNAIKLRNKHIEGKVSLVVPELAFLEVVNALKYKRANLEVIEEAIQDLINIQFEVVNLDEFLMKKAAKISIENNLTIYDSIYASISQIHGAELITSDKELLKIPNSTDISEIN